MNRRWPDSQNWVGALLVVGAGLGALVCVIALGLKVYSSAVGIALGVAALGPCFGSVVMLVVSQKATATLQANGVKVGLLGASPSSVP